jgi:localization factor PodJL
MAAAPAYSAPVQTAPAYSAPAAAPPAAHARTPFDVITGVPPAARTEQAPQPQPPPALPPPAPRAAPIEVEPPTPPDSVRPLAARTMPRNAPRQPTLPPDTPLEPGSGAPRIKPGSAAARIAASEAALGNARPAAMETGGKSAAIAAARNAAKAAYLEAQTKAPRSFGQLIGRWLPTFKKKAKELPAEAQTAAPPQPAMPAPAPLETPSVVPPPQLEDGADASLPRGKKVLKVLKTLLIAASIAIIVVGVAQTAMEYLIPDTPSGPRALPPKDQSKTPVDPTAQAPATTPSQQAPQDPSAAPAPADPSAAPTEVDPGSTNSINRGSQFFDPSPAIKLPDVTGSISRNPAAARTPASDERSSIDALPDSIGQALRMAAVAKDPAAEYELGARYAEGRGVPQNLEEAARWFGLAADIGFAPAQFRLGSLYEKGEGVRKDTQAARRLYLAAASKGHTKAMHNLAVLYAEGIDGKPDYKAASEWFRKAAGYGVTDSQYNLAILFARGIGLQANLGESYRWFALAAASGDRDAAKKRDEVAARLDENTLTALKLAVQSFVPEREPDEATNLGVPPGGWDHPTGTPAKPRRRAPAASAAR